MLGYPPFYICTAKFNLLIFWGVSVAPVFVLCACMCVWFFSIYVHETNWCISLSLGFGIKVMISLWRQKILFFCSLEEYKVEVTVILNVMVELSSITIWTSTFLYKNILNYGFHFLIINKDTGLLFLMSVLGNCLFQGIYPFRLSSLNSCP